MFRHFLINPIYHNLLCFLLFIVEDLKVRPLSRSVWRKSNSHIQVTFIKCTLISAPPSSLFICPSVISITGNILVRFKLGGRAELGPIKNLLNYVEESKLSSREQQWSSKNQQIRLFYCHYNLKPPHNLAGRSQSDGLQTKRSGDEWCHPTHFQPAVQPHIHHTVIGWRLQTNPILIWGLTFCHGPSRLSQMHRGLI